MLGAEVVEADIDNNESVQKVLQGAYGACFVTFFWDHFSPEKEYEQARGMAEAAKDDGNLSITFPMGDKKMAGIAAEDIGKCAYGIFKKGPSLAGKTIGIAGDQLTCAGMAEKLSEVLGEPVSYNEITPAQFRSFGFPGAEDLGNMFQFYRDFDDHCNKIRDVGYSRELNPELQDFEQWLSENAKKLPLE